MKKLQLRPYQCGAGMRWGEVGGSKKSKFITAPPRGAGLKSHIIPAPSLLWGEKNLSGVKTGAKRDVSLSSKNSHLLSIMTLQCGGHCFVGSMLLHALHTNCFILFRHRMLQMSFQIAGMLELSEYHGTPLLPLALVRYFTATLFALLTQKIPRVD